MEPFAVKDVPKYVFGKISESAKEECREEKISGETYLVQELKYGGFIGFTEDENSSSFVLWSRFPKNEDDEYKIVTIRAYPMITGEWAYGNGSKIREVIKAEFHTYDGLMLDHFLTPVAVTALLLANKFASKEECKKETYWQVAKKPDLDYTHAP